ncbi:hypothetical protein KVT40_007055 [Elsinoe batatas]|uniref:Uncharacterized protein n=1 Tax=Elsinoe batatas TaxID=2601811 RepID=A0A8K0PH78_9PEZI|nr:hypothetical protein KVT40_007055 [Elsinoe batatas]
MLSSFPTPPQHRLPPFLPSSTTMALKRKRSVPSLTTSPSVSPFSHSSSPNLPPSWSSSNYNLPNLFPQSKPLFSSTTSQSLFSTSISAISDSSSFACHQHNLKPHQQSTDTPVPTWPHHPPLHPSTCPPNQPGSQGEHERERESRKDRLSSSLPSRTQKRHRDNRPPESIIHAHTLRILFDAQRKEHVSPPVSPVDEREEWEQEGGMEWEGTWFQNGQNGEEMVVDEGLGSGRGGGQRSLEAFWRR